VFVYQQVNRAVVNINTKAVSGNLFLSYESQGEGTAAPSTARPLATTSTY